MKIRSKLLIPVGSQVAAVLAGLVLIPWSIHTSNVGLEQRATIANAVQGIGRAQQIAEDCFQEVALSARREKDLEAQAAQLQSALNPQQQARLNEAVDLVRQSEEIKKHNQAGEEGDLRADEALEVAVGPVHREDHRPAHQTRHRGLGHRPGAAGHRRGQHEHERPVGDRRPARSRELRPRGKGDPAGFPPQSHRQHERRRHPLEEHPVRRDGAGRAGGQPEGRGPRRTELRQHREGGQEPRQVQPGTERPGGGAYREIPRDEKTRWPDRSTRPCLQADWSASSRRSPRRS